jgi:hypothetical protein
MTDWSFIVVPLLVLPIVLLFRFIGCGYSGVATGSSPDKPAIRPGYRDSIKAESSVRAYWRLVDVEVPANEAKDETGFQKGFYEVNPGLPREKKSGSNPGSDAALGGFLFNQEGLIVSDPTAKCHSFEGGHVRVPFKDGLYTEEFTIEAWINIGPEWKNLDFQHVLFSAGGHYVAPSAASAAFHGFEVSANFFSDSSNPKGGENRWKVGFFTDGVVSVDPTTPLPIVPTGSTHVALILKNDVNAPTGPKIWAFYVGGKITVHGTVSFYSPPKGAPLFIGVGKRTADTAGIPEPRFPILSRIQEVVLHTKPLSKEEIENHVTLNS